MTVTVETKTAFHERNAAALAALYTRVQYGTSDALGAAAITNPIERAVIGWEYLPDSRTLRLKHLLEPGGAPAGTEIREIGLLTAAGDLVLRRVGPPIIVTADLGIGEHFDITV